eukprot:TRINITY_DN10579_c0_g4_i1.p1 TRINITY_DN10579_c0_g4~~TRINITY_DN10579_c0_g4_i1.p1  ORF type:complete len:733 (+),score=139.03 TRINITY_DN10579_c0_g4_i1:277-2199(+)
MKEKVRQNLSKPKYSVMDFYHETGVAQQIARSSVFDKFTLGVIAFNAVWIAYDTDENDSDVLINAAPIFIVAENFFCLYFTIEWFTRFLAFRRKRDGLKDGWFVFDSFMVTLMVLETWVFTLLLLFVMDGGGAVGGNTGIIKTAKLLRLSRMARMGKLLRLMPELMIMIKGMKAATRSVSFTLLLLCMIMYIFAIGFVQLAADSPVGPVYFPKVPTSMYTLLIYGIFMDNIGLIAGKLQHEPVLFIVFFLFVLIGAMTVMNMLVGVLCEVVSAVAATEQEEMLVSYVHEKLSRVMALLDSDGGGTISKVEFIKILDNVEAVKCLMDVGVDVFALIDLADYIFQDDDADAKELELDFSRFMEVVLQLRGTNQATVKDIVDLRKFMRLSMAENYKQSAKILEMLQTMKTAQTQDRFGSFFAADDKSKKEKEARAEETPAEEPPACCRLSNEGSTASVSEEAAAPVGHCKDATSFTGSWTALEMDALEFRIPTECETSDAEAAKRVQAKQSPFTHLHAAPCLDTNGGGHGDDKLTAAVFPHIQRVKAQEAPPWPGPGQMSKGWDARPDPRLLDSIPKFAIPGNSTGTFSDAELEAFQRHIDAMCKQLAMGIGDAIAMAGRSAENRLCVTALPKNGYQNAANVT